MLIEAVGPGCASCPASNVRYAYDERGEVIRIERAGADEISYVEHITRDGSGRIVQREIERGGSRALLESYEYDLAQSASLPVRIVRPSAPICSEKL